MEPLILSKNGELYKKTWNPKAQDYTVTEVSKFAIRHMFDICEIEEGVTLKDIFLLLNKNLKVFDQVIGNWCEAIVKEGLKPKESLLSTITKGRKQPLAPDEDESLDFLELYWAIYPEKNEDEKITLTGLAFPSFHAIKIAKANNTMGYKEGDPINYAIDFSPANSLIHLPVVLKKPASVFNDFDDNIKLDNYNVDYTLGHILYGILWELSFHGDPTNRNNKANELMASIDEISDKLKK